MIKKLVVLAFLPTVALSQDVIVSRFENLPVIVSVNFMAISTPFQKMRNNFRNVGLRIGTEVTLNQKENLFQSVNVGYYRNRLNGDAVYINSEFIYRPKIREDLRLEFKVGPGLGEIFRPSRPWKPDGNGGWQKASIGGRLNSLLYAGVGIRYDNLNLNNVLLSPFLQYEMMGVINYNKGVPLLPASFINAGSRIRF